jgi:hypothetical protein
MQNTTSMQNEIWKDIKGYEGYYQISNLGRVKSLAKTIFCKNNRNKKVAEIILKPSISANGYPGVTLCTGKYKRFSVHRLVAISFIPNPENKPTVNHINGVKYDNRVENLEWATYIENNRHAFDTGLTVIKKGEFSHRYGMYGKLHAGSKIVLDLNTGVYYESLAEAAKYNNVCQKQLSNFLLGKRKNKTSLIYA